MRKEKTVVSVYDGSAVPGFISGDAVQKIPHRRMGRRSERRMKKAEEKKRIR